jgi:iron complex transport system permease protein
MASLQLDRLVVLRSRRLGWSALVHPRAVVATVAALAAATGVFVWSLAVGDFPLPVSEVVRSVLGLGGSDADFVVRTLRLPRGLTALLVGAAFGLSGAVFQRLTRNPLASPDIIGINAGAATAAAFAIVVFEASATTVVGAALAGSLLTAVAVYVLAYRQGLSPYRLVLVGIGATAVLTSATSYLLTRADIMDAKRALVWLTGSLNGRSWDHVRPASVALVLLVPLTMALARHLRMLELGDEAATALGARVEAARSLLVVAGCLLAAVATAAAGPVAFVALVAPQIARRLVGGRSLALLPSAACGALLVVAADLAGRRMFAPTELPVGIVTSVIGAPYLLYLLARANRIGSGG